MKALCSSIILAFPLVLFANITWVPAGNLQSRQMLKTENGNIIQAVSVTKKPGKSPMYNLTISHNHNFFIGNQFGKVLVHNDCSQAPYYTISSDEYSCETCGSLHPKRYSKQSIVAMLKKNNYKKFTDPDTDDTAEVIFRHDGVSPEPERITVKMDSPSFIAEFLPAEKNGRTITWAGNKFKIPASSEHHDILGVKPGYKKISYQGGQPSIVIRRPRVILRSGSTYFRLYPDTSRRGIERYFFYERTANLVSI